MEVHEGGISIFEDRGQFLPKFSHLGVVLGILEPGPVQGLRCHIEPLGLPRVQCATSIWPTFGISRRAISSVK